MIDGINQLPAPLFPKGHPVGSKMVKAMVKDGTMLLAVEDLGVLKSHILWLFNKKLLKMAIEIVDFPINSMVIFHSYVSLPEGIFWGVNSPCCDRKNAGQAE